MYNESRTDIYDYLCDLVKANVTNNVYVIGEPQDLTTSDKNNGFVVVKVGSVNDQSQFDREAYGWARVYLTAYVPSGTRGRVNKEKYTDFENKINAMINDAELVSHNNFVVVKNSTLSMDSVAYSTANNLFHTFIKSFRILVLQND